jgi:hypothetical protein
MKKKTTVKKGPLGTPLGNPLGFFNSQKAKRSAEPKQNLRKAQNGISVPYMGGTKENPSNVAPTFDQVGIKNTYQGPLNEKDQMALDRAYPSTAFAPTASGKGAPASYSKSGRVHATRSPREQGYMTAEAGEEYNRKRAENYLRSDHKNMKRYNQYPQAEAEDAIFDKNSMTEAEDRKMESGEAYKRGGSVKKKMQDGGILTPHGRLKSKKTRDVSLSPYGNSSSVSRTKRNGDTVTRSVNTNNGYAGTTADKTKTVTNKAGETVSKKTKNISAKSADRKINRVINNVGRNANDTWAYKKGGVASKTKKRK